MEQCQYHCKNLLKKHRVISHVCFDNSIQKLSGMSGVHAPAQSHEKFHIYLNSTMLLIHLGV